MSSPPRHLRVDTLDPRSMNSASPFFNSPRETGVPVKLVRSSSIPSSTSLYPSTPHLPAYILSLHSTPLILSLRSHQLTEAHLLHTELTSARSDLLSPWYGYLSTFPFIFTWRESRFKFFTHPIPYPIDIHRIPYTTYLSQLKTRVTHLQAVITRRLHSIGIIQSHILRRSWSKGVTGWGIIGGGAWFTSLEGTVASRADRVRVDAASEIGVEVDYARLCNWCVDAVRLVRHQMLRAGGGISRLQYSENWGGEFDLDELNTKTPIWAGDGGRVIVDAKGMKEEVKWLEGNMPRFMGQQMERRYLRLKGLNYWRRRWYWMISLPFVVGGVYRCCKNEEWFRGVMGRVFTKVGKLWVEHVVEPGVYIYNEFFTSKIRDKITDRAALLETRSALTRMLKGWFKDQYPDMSSIKINKMAENMDVGLIEKEFEKGVTTNTMRNVLTGDIVRMCLIEMQFLKKELLTAMDAMDDLMEANEFNLRVSSMVPAFIGMYSLSWFFKKVYYSVGPGGRQSREVVYESFRNIVLDIERLLVMRDDPPPTPASLQVGKWKERVRSGSIEKEPMVGLSFDDEGEHQDPNKPNSTTTNNGTITLNENDWGMVILLLHEARTILETNKRRFARSELPSLREDLAEIAGERGPVSVKQQLQIVKRMSRTYNFLREIGDEFDFF
ncbi:hypothetical protein TrLO_g6169 [Triparma laevis f. longispina]|uniref:Uncharacterized protein n=1 Tax=Triparma laevis f. longispina TaxID=1714387 RepID=A0A9W7CLK6_9STRA|nr:hypothetical protein TrLO_g6169 [Triparma laevis f. longispina]